MTSSMNDSNVIKRGHALLFPGQLPGLFGPFVQVLYHLDSIRSGFTVTLVTHRRFLADIAKLQKNGSLQSIDLRIEEVPGAVPTGENDPDFQLTGEVLSDAGFLETEKLRNELTTKKGTSEAPTVIIGDCVFPWCKNFADEMQIPCYIMYHCASSLTLTFLEVPRLWKAGCDPQLATNDDDNLVPAETAPGPSFVDTHVFSLLGMTEYPPEVIDTPEYSVTLMENTINSAGILMNTAEALEMSYGVLSAVKKLMGPSKVFCIGPSIQIPGFGLAYSSASAETVLSWLSSQQNKSVLYVSFGSVAVISKESMTELAAGLESSVVPFLLLLRVSAEELSEILPPAFEERTSGRGRVETGWVNQCQILQHPAIGGYLTHCGWNSTLEGICSGLPFITWPVFIDQPVNARYLQDVLKIGIAVADIKTKNKHITDNITRREVEMAIRKLMFQEEGQRLRENVEKLQRQVVEAVSEGGSSYRDVRRFLDQISS